jgi:hypothetical protein
MTDFPRRTVQELHARYTYEPELDDIYVEGVFDQEIFAECLKSIGRTDRVVYSIDTVDVGADILEKYGFTSGNKQRVMALARELSGLVGDLKYRCVVDRDLDQWFNRIENTPRLSWLDCCSIELYFFESTERVIKIAGRAKIGDFELFHNSFVETLKRLYSFRLADSEMNLNVEWIEVDRFLTIRGDAISFDDKEYVKRLANKNKFNADIDRFLENVEKWYLTLEGDPKTFIRGHDFVELVAWSIKAFRGVKEIASASAFERFMVLSAKDFPVILNCIT